MVSSKHWLSKLRSALNPQAKVLEWARGSLTPGLKVVQRGSTKLLEAPHANYSYGRLEQVFREAFYELGIRARKPHKALLLGLGGGCVARMLHRQLPQLHITGVELDPEVLRLATKHFNLVPTPTLRIVQAAAEEFIAHDMATYDLLLVDVFIDTDVPPALDEMPFFQALKRRLAPGGLLLFNRIINEAAAARATDAAWPAFRRVFPSAYPLNTLGNRLWVVDVR